MEAWILVGNQSNKWNKSSITKLGMTPPQHNMSPDMYGWKTAFPFGMAYCLGLCSRSSSLEITVHFHLGMTCTETPLCGFGVKPIVCATNLTDASNLSERRDGLKPPQKNIYASQENGGIWSSPLVIGGNGGHTLGIFIFLWKGLHIDSLPEHFLTPTKYRRWCEWELE